jgi:hypothetical protein
MIKWERLAEPFDEEDIEWRVGRAGKKGNKIWAKVLAYITARAIMDRLDEVFGVAGWKEEFREGPDGGVICRIYFKDDNGEWIWREDGADNTDIESVKGGLSSARKRAGAALGIGRYLYQLEEGFAEIDDNGPFMGVTKEKQYFRYFPPALPKWALPASSTPKKKKRAA